MLEGGNIIFTVTKSNDATSLTHQVSFTTANGSAVSGSDYVAQSGTLTFAPAELSKTITIVGAGDTTFELQETFNVNLSAPTNSATISDGTGLGTITDNDTAPHFDIGNAAFVVETVGVVLTFPVTKTGSSDVSHQVSFATANGTATAGADYVAQSGTLTFGPGPTGTQNIIITGVNDGIFELTETFTVVLSAPTNSATISDGTGLGGINDDDTAPSFSIDDPPAVLEGASITFTVTKSNDATSLTHQVFFTTTDGSAVAGSDYVAQSGTLTFAPAELSKTIIVLTSTDAVTEAQETFTVQLSAPTNSATISDGSGIGAIDDNVPNNPPIAVNDSYTVPTFDVRNLLVLDNDSDPDGHSLRITNVTTPSKGSAFISCSETCILYSAGSQDGNTSFIYTIDDGFGATDTATVSITITNGGGPAAPEPPPPEEDDGDGTGGGGF